MKTTSRAAARRRLDRATHPLRGAMPPLPPAGWIRAMRNALGLTTTALGQRLGVSAAAVTQLEQSERQSRIRVDSLQRAAEAMDCTLMYVFVPNEPLEDMVHRRARALARARLEAVAHTMRLEDQAVTAERLDELIEELARELAGSRELWKPI